MANIRNFNQNTYENLPTSLGFLTSFSNPQDRDIALLSCLNACATALPGVYYKKKYETCSPHTFIYVYGPSGSGKSNTKYGQKLTKGVDDALHFERLKEIQNWKDTSPKERADSPPFMSSHTLQKMTSANLWKQLKYQGEEGNYLRFFEASELTNSFGSENGISKEELINIYDQVPLRKNINTDSFFARIDKPKASLGLSSTGETFKAFAKNHYNNGLLSRFLIYKTYRVDSESDFFYEKNPILDPKSEMERSANIVKNIWSYLRSLEGGICVEFSPEFKRRINDLGDLMRSTLVQKNAAYFGYSRRFPENIYRLCVVYAALRQYDNDLFFDEKIQVDCVDFLEGIQECLLKNVEYAVDSVATVDLNYRGGIENEIDLGDLPLQFSSRDFITSTSLPQATAFRRLKKLEKSGLIKKIGHGVYQKLPSAL